MTEPVKNIFDEILTKKIQAGRIDSEDRQYIIDLIRRDAPGKLKTYFTIDWETTQQFRGVKCATCGRHIHKINHKHTVSKNRFCPQCGQRLDWAAYQRAEEEREAQRKP